jgi:hypothetical protein
LNIIWGLINLLLCLFLYIASKISITNKWTIIIFGIGFITMSSFAFLYKR